MNASDKKMLARWRRGDSDFCPPSLSFFLRAYKQGVDTSNGYRLTYRGVKILAKLARRHRQGGEHDSFRYSVVEKLPKGSIERHNIWVRGITFSSTGTITVGCTTVTWSEIERLALNQGWWKEKTPRGK